MFSTVLKAAHIQTKMNLNVGKRAYTFAYIKTFLLRDDEMVKLSLKVSFSVIIVIN